MTTRSLLSSTNRLLRSSIADLEVRIPEEIHPCDGILYHLREGIRDAECNEPDRGPETRRDITESDDLEKR